MRIAVSYCGNCNPEINSPRIIDQWMRTLKGDEVVFQLEGKEPADLLIIMCGCKKACADRPEIRAMGKRIILIRGRWIEGLTIAENELGNELLRRVASMRGEMRRNVKVQNPNDK
jgi:hypothetical protein